MNPRPLLTAPELLTILAWAVLIAWLWWTRQPQVEVFAL